MASQAHGHEPLLASLESKDAASDEKAAEIRTPSQIRVANVIVSLAMLGLVAYAAASPQSPSHLRSSNVGNAVDLVEKQPSTYYWVTSTWKSKEDAKKGEKKIKEIAADPQIYKKAFYEE